MKEFDMEAAQRNRRLRIVLEQLACIDIDPSYKYYVETINPTKFVLKGGYAYAFGPDHMLWMTDYDGETRVSWEGAGPVHHHLEYFWGELYKIRALHDDDYFLMLEQLLVVVHELQSHILAD